MNNLFETAFNRAPIGMALVAPDGRWLKVNSFLSAIVGYSEAELLQTDFQSITHPDDLQQDLAHMQRLLTSQSDFYDTEKRYIHKNGHVVWVSLSVSLVLDEAQKPSYFIAHIQDITERKQEQLNLLETEALYRLISENAQDIITYTSPDGVTRYVSPSVRRLLGYEPEEIIGTISTDFYHPDDLVELGSRIFKDEDSFTCRVRHKDGRWIWFETTFKLIRKQDGEIDKILGIGRDITERKRAESQLRRREESMARAQSIAHFGSWDWNIETDNLFWSEELSRILGLDQSDIVPSFTLFLSFVHPDDQEMVQKAVQQSFGGQEFDLEFRLIRLDGSERIVRSQGDVIFKNYKPLRMIGTLFDITEVKRAEQAAISSELKFRAVVESANDAIIVTDCKGEIISWNGAAEWIFGFTKEEAIGKSITLIIPVQYRDAHEKGMEQFFATGDRKILGKTLEFEALKKDGSVIPVEISLTTWGDGKDLYFSGIFRDISERKNAERQLSESEKQFRLISENSLDVISKHTPDKDAIFTYVSPACESMFGYTPEELLGHSTYEFYHPDDLPQMTADIQQLLNLNDIKVIFRFRRKDGAYIWVETTARTILDEKGNPKEILVFSRDVSDRNRQLEEIAQLNYQNSLILDSVAEGIYGMDLNKKIMFFNRAASKMLGFEQKDVIGKSPSETFRHHVQIEPKLYYADLQAKGIHIVSDELFYRKDGSSIPVEFMTTPMMDNGRIVGAVINFTDISMRKEEERLKEERKQIDLELSLAASVQESLLPACENINTPKNCEVGVVSVPARTLNGDFYNFSTNDRTFLFGVADISGKGIPAAILMSMMKFAMDEAVKQGHSPSNVLDVLNRYALQYTDNSMFVTMFVGSYEKDKHRFHYASAGHEPGILYRAATDSFEVLDTEGIVLGLSADFAFHSKYVDLEPGDMVVLYTDGLIEQRDNPLADNNEILKSLLRGVDHSASAQMIAEEVHNRVREMNDGKMSDDETLLLFRRNY